MAYRVVNDFEDSKDKGKAYKRGEEYPRGAYKPSKERIEELSKIHPKYNLIFIEEIPEPKSTSTKTKTAAKKADKGSDDKNDKS